MNLIILAAGKGTRLFPLTKNTPKSLLDLGDGTTLLDRQIDNAIESKSITKVYVVTGYRSDQIEKAVQKYQNQIQVEIIYNPFYDMSNNLLSLWCAHYIMQEDDFIITNGDNIYNSNVYPKVINATKDTIQITVDYKDSYDDDDMKVVIANSCLAAVSKKIEIQHTDGESVGLVLVKGSSKRVLFRSKLLEMVKLSDNINNFWLEIFNSLISDGEKIDLCEIEHSDWGEIDFHPDIDSIKKAVFKNLF